MYVCMHAITEQGVEEHTPRSRSILREQMSEHAPFFPKEHGVEPAPILELEAAPQIEELVMPWLSRSKEPRSTLLQPAFFDCGK